MIYHWVKKMQIGTGKEAVSECGVSSKNFPDMKGCTDPYILVNCPKCLQERDRQSALRRDSYSVVINDALVKKLESITQDIKYYVNTNASIAQSGASKLILMQNEDLDELLEIRNRLKKLTRNLKRKL